MPANAGKCMFDTFLDICRQDYVGEISGDAVTKLIHEVCKQISAVKMEKRHGQRCIDTPDEIYAKYISILSGLPHDADKWSITICSSYFSCLPLSLQDKMEEDGFTMPNLSGQTTKTLQIQALCVVQTASAASFKTLQDEEFRLRCLFSN